MRKLILLASIFATHISNAQITADPKTFADLISKDALKKHLYTVAGKDFEGRETGTEGQRRAATYIENYFKTVGLLPGNQDSYQMFFPFYQDSLEDISISINDQHFRVYEDIDASLSANHSSVIFGSEVVFAGYGVTDSSHDDYKGLDVQGKIALVLSGYPPDQLQEQINKKIFNAYRKQDAAQQHGAVALLIAEHDFPRKDISEKGILYLDPYKKVNRLNTYYISENVAKKILGKDYDAIQNGHIQPKSYDRNIRLEFTKSVGRLKSSNVMGMLEGTDLKDELVIISAHYDHVGKKDTMIYYGADDDGSGTVTVMEIAAAFAQAKAAGFGPRRSILFLAHSGEEEGLWGSEYYTDHPVYPLEKTTADLNIDMLGRICPQRKYGDSNNYVYIVGDDLLSSELRTIVGSSNKKYTKLELDHKFNDPKDPERIYYRSDHYSFARKGVPVIFFYDGSHKDYHKPTDTPDKINYDLLAKRAKLVFYTAWDIANRDEMLKRDIPAEKK